MGRATGIEPATTGATDRCSTIELRSPQRQHRILTESTWSLEVLEAKRAFPRRRCDDIRRLLFI